AAIHRHHPNQSDPIPKDRILEDFLFSQIRDIALEISHPQRDFNQALVVWSENIGLMRVQPVETGEFDSHSDHCETGADKQSNWRIEKVFVPGDLHQGDQKGCYYRNRCEPEREQENSTQSS